MKRSAPDSQVPGADQKMKKVKEEAEEKEEESGLMNLDENLLYEILKHMDARTLAMASCVSKLWLKTAKDERLWELICTRHWANIGYGTQQLRSVVLPLGGFRRLHSLCLWPLSKPQAASASIINSKPHARWGKDEQLRNHFVFLRRTGGGCKKKEHLDPMDKACLLELRRWYDPNMPCQKCHGIWFSTVYFGMLPPGSFLSALLLWWAAMESSIFLFQVQLIPEK